MTIASFCYVLRWCKYRNVFEKLLLVGMWNVQLRGSIMGSHMSLFLEFSIQFGGETHCGFSGFQTWWSTDVQKPTGSLCLSFNPPLNLTTVPSSCSYLPGYSFEFTMWGQFLSHFILIHILSSWLRRPVEVGSFWCWQEVWGHGGVCGQPPALTTWTGYAIFKQS